MLPGYVTLVGVNTIEPDGTNLLKGVNLWWRIVFVPCLQSFLPVG